MFLYIMIMTYQYHKNVGIRNVVLITTWQLVKLCVVLLRLRLYGYACTPTIQHLTTPGRTAAKVGHIKHSNLSMIDYYPSSSSSKPVVSSRVASVVLQLLRHHVCEKQQDAATCKRKQEHQNQRHGYNTVWSTSSNQDTHVPFMDTT